MTSSSKVTKILFHLVKPSRIIWILQGKLTGIRQERTKMRRAYEHLFSCELCPYKTGLSFDNFFFLWTHCVSKMQQSLHWLIARRFLLSTLNPAGPHFSFMFLLQKQKAFSTLSYFNFPKFSNTWSQPTIIVSTSPMNLPLLPTTHWVFTSLINFQNDFAEVLSQRLLCL